jgi:MATE family multidrug resistance protein
MADMAVAGRLDSNVYIGAIALGSMIFNLIYWTFGFLRMGTSGLTAQAMGAKNQKEITGTLTRGLLVAALGALLILLLQIPIERLTFYLINGSSEVEQLAKSYFYIRVWAAPATIGLYALTGWFIGMQNTKTPMFIALTVNLLNIGLNLLFVFKFNLKSDGVAWGTLVSQYVGLGLALYVLCTKYKSFINIPDYHQILDAVQLKKFFKVNGDIFIRTMSLLAVFTFFTSHSASENNQVLAANSLLLQFLFIFSFLTDGFAYAAEALTGKYFGAKDFSNLKQSIRINFMWGGIIAILFTVIYAFANKSILLLLTNQTEIIETATQYTFWIILIPIVSVASFIWDGVFIGLTATPQMRNSMLIAAFFVFFPTWYFFHFRYGNHALWLAFILFLFTRGVAQSIMFKNIKFNTCTDNQ